MWRLASCVSEKACVSSPRFSAVLVGGAVYLSHESFFSTIFSSLDTLSVSQTACVPSGCSWSLQETLVSEIHPKSAPVRRRDVFFIYPEFKAGSWGEAARLVDALRAYKYSWHSFVHCIWRTSVPLFPHWRLWKGLLHVRLMKFCNWISRQLLTEAPMGT